jgi:hypothetical protein
VLDSNNNNDNDEATSFCFTVSSIFIQARQCLSYYYTALLSPFTMSFQAFEAVKPGLFEAGISISAPVWGLRPLRAARDLGWKLPNPGKVTLFPMATCFIIVNRTVFNTCSDSFLLVVKVSDKRVTNSAFFNVGVASFLVVILVVLRVVVVVAAAAGGVVGVTTTVKASELPVEDLTAGATAALADFLDAAPASPLAFLLVADSRGVMATGRLSGDTVSAPREPLATDVKAFVDARHTSALHAINCIRDDMVSTKYVCMYVCMYNTEQGNGWVSKSHRKKIKGTSQKINQPLIYNLSLLLLEQMLLSRKSTEKQQDDLNKRIDLQSQALECVMRQVAAMHAMPSVDSCGLRCQTTQQARPLEKGESFAVYELVGVAGQTKDRRKTKQRSLRVIEGLTAGKIPCDIVNRDIAQNQKSTVRSLQRS